MCAPMMPSPMKPIFAMCVNLQGYRGRALRLQGSIGNPKAPQAAACAAPRT
ncbi:hypothetical protein OKW36_006043 [Paraburkholderia sp. MM5482-R1]